MGIKFSKQRHKPRITKAQIPWLLRGAIRSNNVETMQYLLTYPNHVDPSMVIDGVCPLNLAVELGHIQMVKILLKAGADVHVADAPRYPLHQSAIYGRPDIAELLIKSGASINALTATRQSCLHLLAGQTSHRFQETAKIFLRYGADPNQLDDDGLAPLHIASVDMIDVFSSHELTNLNILSKNGDSPLLVMTKDRKEPNVIAMIAFAEHEEASPPDTHQEQEKTAKSEAIERQNSGENGDLIPSELSDIELLPEDIIERKRRNSRRIPKRSDSGCISSHNTPIHRRTASSKSSVSVASRMTLISNSTGGKKVPGVIVGRANSAASVNLHTIRHSFKHHRVRGGHQHAAAGLFQSLFSYPSTSACTKKLEAAIEFISHNHKNSSSIERHNSSSVSTLSGAFRVFGGLRKSRSLLKNNQVSTCNDLIPGWQRLSSSSKQRFFPRNADSDEHQGVNTTVQRASTTTSSSLCGASNSLLTSFTSAPNARNSPRLSDRPVSLSGSIHVFSGPPSVASTQGFLKQLTRSCNTPADEVQHLPCHPYVLPTVRAKVNIDQQDKIGMTALMIAAEAGTTGLGMFQALINAKADIQIVDKMGMTALHYACYVGSLCTVRYVFEHPTKNATSQPVGVQNSITGSVAYLGASRTSLFADGSIGGNGIPKRAGYDLLNTQDKYGRTPIYLATARGHTDVVNYLINIGADIHIANKESKSPLYISAYFGYIDIVNALLRRGAKVDQADSHHKTPLYVATYHGRFDVVDLLLSAGANVNSVDKNGKTALYIAVLHGHLALANKLLSAGAFVNRPDHEGLGPLHMAVKFPKLDIPMIKLLLKHGCDPVNLAAFTRWLIAHGIISEEYIEGDAELSSWLHLEESNVRSLKRLCRQEIQRALGNADSMRYKIARLPLPEQLRSYVSMKAL